MQASEKQKVPYNLEAEMRILGGCMRSVDWVNKTVAELNASDFFSTENRHIFATIKDLYESDSNVTFDTIEARICLKTCSLNHLVDVLSVGSTYFDISEFMKPVKDASKKRDFQAIGNDLIRDCSDNTKSAKEVLESVEAQLFSSADSVRGKAFRHVKEILNDPKPYLQELQERQDLFREGKSAFKGTPSGYYDLDKHLKGFCPGHVTLIGARPGVGKTTMALNLVENLANKYKAPVMFFSLEMPAKELLEKLLCQYAEVSMPKHSDGNFGSEEFHRLASASRAIEKQTILIDEQPSLSIDQFKARAVRAKRMHDIKVIFVDYVQLLTSNKKGTDMRHLEIGDISRRLKETAKELDVAIVALAQLNRDVEKRTDKKPFLADLRESGSLEADADEILLLHRPEMYDVYDKPGLMEVIVAKNRFGPTGQFYLVYQKETGNIKNYDPIYKSL